MSRSTDMAHWPIMGSLRRHQRRRIWDMSPRYIWYIYIERFRSIPNFFSFVWSCKIRRNDGFRLNSALKRFTAVLQTIWDMQLKIKNTKKTIYHEHSAYMRIVHGKSFCFVFTCFLFLLFLDSVR